MTNPWRNYFTTAAIALVFAMSALCLPAQENAKSDKKTSTLTVSGESEISAPPDRAMVRLGVTQQADEAGAAQEKVNGSMQKVIDQIVKTGIVRRSIRTIGLTLTPIYAPQRPQSTETPRVVAYRAANIVEVTVDDLKLVGAVIDAGMSAGANEVEGISFRIQNDLPQRTRALAAAVEEAKVKADAIAGALGVKLVKVSEVNEGGVSVMPRGEGFGGGRMFAAAAMKTQVEPGEMQVHASVTIRYEISP